MKRLSALFVLTLLAIGCSSKQQVIQATSTIQAPTVQLKSVEMGGGKGSGFELLKPEGK